MENKFFIAMCGKPAFLFQLTLKLAFTPTTVANKKTNLCFFYKLLFKQYGELFKIAAPKNAIGNFYTIAY